MIPVLLAVVTLAASPLSAPDYTGIYDKGISYAQFLEAAQKLKDEWQKNYANAAIDEASIARAKGLKGSWRLLVVAEDWCHDSVGTVPYLAKLADASPDTLQLHIVNKAAGEEVIGAHKTRDGRAATPTIVVLDALGAVKGVIAERPAALWEYSKDHSARADRWRWYADDQGRHAIAEILDIIEIER
jgi:hypothetical protein